MVEHGRVFPIDRNMAERVESLPSDSGRICHPIFVRTRVAARLFGFLNHLRIRRFELRLHAAELLIRVNLEAQVVDADRLPMARDGKVDARIVQHPLGVIVFQNRRVGTEHLRVEPDTVAEIGDRDVNVKALHDVFLLRNETSVDEHPFPPQQFSVRKLNSSFI